MKMMIASIEIFVCVVAAYVRTSSQIPLSHVSLQKSSCLHIQSQCWTQTAAEMYTWRCTWRGCQMLLCPWMQEGWNDRQFQGASFLSQRPAPVLMQAEQVATKECMSYRRFTGSSITHKYELESWNVARNLLPGQSLHWHPYWEAENCASNHKGRPSYKEQLKDQVRDLKHADSRKMSCLRKFPQLPSVGKSVDAGATNPRPTMNLARNRYKACSNAFLRC